MKLSVASNFDNALIDRIKNQSVFELYGKLPEDFVGGGRSTYMLSPISKSKFEEHVAYTRKNGIGFNYILNASCLNNQEITRTGQKEIRKLLDWMSKIDVTATTVSNPYLLRLIKESHPHFRIRVSVFAGVDHLRKAKYWEDIGADVICLDSLTVNREFKTLKHIRKGLSCELELLVNNNCLQSCALSPTHMNLLAHSSQSKHENSGFVVDHCIMECSKIKAKEPVNYIRSDWIRPEDIHHYESIGIEHFKLVERNLPTELMSMRVKAYHERRYEGNLINLIQPYGHKQKDGEKRNYIGNFFWKLSFLVRPSKVNPLKLTPFKKLSELKGMLGNLDHEPVIIDNRNLDGFIDRFIKMGCRDVNCEECRHCHEFADKAVKIDSNYQKEALVLHHEIDKSLLSGSLWKW